MDHNVFEGDIFLQPIQMCCMLCMLSGSETGFFFFLPAVRLVPWGWGRGGEGGTQIWFRRGCAAEAAKPVPIFKGHFGGKGYPLVGFFIQENDAFVYFSDKMGENI